MKLDSIDRIMPVTNPHDDAVGCPGRDFQLIRKIFSRYDERVISPGLEGISDLPEQRLIVVEYA